MKNYYICLVLSLSIFYSQALQVVSDMESTFFYIGTYINPSSPQDPSVFLYKLTNQGELTQVSFSNAGKSPSYMTVSLDNEYLYVVNELDSGEVTSFKIVNENEGGLKEVNKVSSKGSAPCHISYDKSEKFLMVSNYNSGSLLVLPIDSTTGALFENKELFIQHIGTGPNKDRQLSAHAHSCFMHPSNRYAFSVDLGMDSIFLYERDNEKNILNPNPIFVYKTVPGSGPRHLVFNENGDVIYLVSELDNTISVLLFDIQLKTIKRVQTLSTLPSDFKGSSGCAAVRISSDGKFVYASNRGHDSIAAFRVNDDNITLSLVSITSTNGRHPRDFNLDHSGNFLIVACRDDNVINVFRRNKDDGTIFFTGVSAKIPTPVNICLLN